MAQATENITPDAWLYSKIPKGPGRIDIDMRLILHKTRYERFMHLIGNDHELFRDIVSSIVNGKLEDWTGKYADVGEPEVEIGRAHV